MRMSSRGGGFLFTNEKDLTTDVLMLPRTDSLADAGSKSDKLGKLSYGVVPTRLGLAIRVLKTNTEQARLALNPELVNLVGQSTMLCATTDANKYLVKGLDNGISQREVAQLFLDTIAWSVKPLNPTKGADKKRPDYIVCADRPPTSSDICLGKDWIKITQWIPPQAKRTSAWDRGESKYGLAQIIKDRMRTADHTYNECDDDDDGDDDNELRSGFYTDDAKRDNEGDNGMDARDIPDGEPVRSWADASEVQPTLPSSLHNNGHGNAAGSIPNASRESTEATRATKASNPSKFDELILMIQQSEARNAEKIEESKRNMEIANTTITDQMSKLESMILTMADIQQKATETRGAELAAIEARFEANAATAAAAAKQLGDVASMIAKMQTSMDALACRMPDDNPAKARAVGAGTD